MSGNRGSLRRVPVAEILDRQSVLLVWYSHSVPTQRAVSEPLGPARHLGVPHDEFFHGSRQDDLFQVALDPAPTGLELFQCRWHRHLGQIALDGGRADVHLLYAFVELEFGDVSCERARGVYACTRARCVCVWREGGGGG